MFDSLVQNALDFLLRSVFEIQKNPKSSVIDFCTAIELFLKARLLIEHWVLIYQDPKSADLNNFRKGDFQSVGMKDAIPRLENVLGSKQITKDAKETFDRIRQHRNRLIHFFHPAYTDKPGNTSIQKVVAEQCRGWFYLYPLLTNSWQNFFASYHPIIEMISSQMLKNRDFLRMKFDAYSQGIEKGKAKGKVFLACEACGFEAARIVGEKLSGPLFSTECLVCNNQSRVFQIQCHKCSSNIIIRNFFAPQPDREIGDIEISCNNCSTLMSFEDILNMYPSDPDESYTPFLAICGNFCLHSKRKSAVSFCDDDERGCKWVCLSCCDVEGEAWECDNCGQLITGEFIGPFCVLCEFGGEPDSQFPSEHIM